MTATVAAHPDQRTLRPPGSGPDVRSRSPRDTGGDDGGDRHAVRPRHYLMCPPTYFDVAYAINPWMDPSTTVDRPRAQRQWDALVAAYERLGHRVSRLAPVPGLPDMVFTANGALVVDGRALVANFVHPQRRAEADHHLAWARANVDADAGRATHANEAEGDLLVVGDVVLAGTGFRTDAASHAQVAATFDREVLTLDLVDPRFYHLDVAVGVLDDDRVAYFPPALAPASRAALRRRFPDAIEVSEADALVLGCNVVGDGRHVVVDERAVELAGDLAEAGFVPVPVAVDEFTKAGGGIKCLTMEVRPGPDRGEGHPERPPRRPVRGHTDDRGVRP